MKGELTPDYTAHIALEVLEAGNSYELIVDTGFNDYLYLPEDAILNWNLPFLISTVVSYADGSSAVCDLYEANVVWFGTTCGLRFWPGRQAAMPSSGWDCWLDAGLKLMM